MQKKKSKVLLIKFILITSFLFVSKIFGYVQPTIYKCVMNIILKPLTLSKSIFFKNFKFKLINYIYNEI